MEKRLEILETSMSDVKVRLAVAESNIKGIQEDISTIKDDTRWLRRTITGSLIAVGITAIIAIIKTGGI